MIHYIKFYMDISSQVKLDTMPFQISESSFLWPYQARYKLMKCQCRYAKQISAAKEDVWYGWGEGVETRYHFSTWTPLPTLKHQIWSIRFSDFNLNINKKKKKSRCRIVSRFLEKDAVAYLRPTYLYKSERTQNAAFYILSTFELSVTVNRKLIIDFKLSL